MCRAVKWHKSIAQLAQLATSLHSSTLHVTAACKTTCSASAGLHSFLQVYTLYEVFVKPRRMSQHTTNVHGPSGCQWHKTHGENVHLESHLAPECGSKNAIVWRRRDRHHHGMYPVLRLGLGLKAAAAPRIITMQPVHQRVLVLAHAHSTAPPNAKPQQRAAARDDDNQQPPAFSNWTSGAGAHVKLEHLSPASSQQHAAAPSESSMSLPVELVNDVHISADIGCTGRADVEVGRTRTL
ncbi:hypothetical protein JKP88DRAFT_245262 [Tribonema minus]|uniref:Uncharacterized protein n=1 Tax=Tribonema minus TaxID=303371 RepID=A0A836CEE4_9STRA|nr:hypothetical protein JKP88DRAFT_245262 [Tribonema minus]